VDNLTANTPKLTWVSNTPKETPLMEDSYWLWRNSLVEGPPLATAHRTVQQLIIMGIIGLYKRED
jgi:hypothetical protein